MQHRRSASQETPEGRRAQLAASIRELRGDLTQSQLGDELGVTQSTISMWEQGTYVPSLEYLRLLDRAFGLPAGGLLARAGYVESPPTLMPGHLARAWPRASADSTDAFSEHLAALARDFDASLRSGRSLIELLLTQGTEHPNPPDGP